MSEYHISVMKEQTIKGLSIDSEGIYVDGTAGGGGHSESIAHILGGGRLLCIDRDIDAQAAAKERLKQYKNVDFVQDNFKNLPLILKDKNIDKIDGILLDLGVSSYQLDNAKRGFSYINDARLDMRMNKEDAIDAWEVVNKYPIEELKRIFKEYGEEKFAGKIAKSIEEKRKIKPIETTGELVQIIEKCVPHSKTKGHPAKRVFQALRIEVNGELEGLYEFIISLPKLMNDNGRICIITFHSLEDRIVKNAYKKMADPCECPKEFPVCVCNKKTMGRIITRKPIIPTEEEIRINSRSKSAKLRIFEVKKSISNE